MKLFPCQKCGLALPQNLNNWRAIEVSAHPWEDFAETFAHYFHMLDTIETAHVFGLAVSPRLPQGPGAVFDFHPRDAGTEQLVEAWVALTFAVNAINRSMGLHDLYPFVLNAPAVAKLAFAAQRIAAAGAASEGGTAAAPAA